VLVEVRGRALIFDQPELSSAGDRRRRSNRRDAPVEQYTPSHAARSRRNAAAEVDLHGLTVERALERAERALDDALLADFQELRFIHGRSGGRIRLALHGWLRTVASVRSFRLDPRNEGVTIVSL